MKNYFCPPLEKEIHFFYFNGSPFRILMTFADSGEVIGDVFVRFPNHKERCGFVDSKTFPWLPSFLEENGIAKATTRILYKDDFFYDEFYFFKED